MPLPFHLCPRTGHADPPCLHVALIAMQLAVNALEQLARVDCDGQCTCEANPGTRCFSCRLFQLSIDAEGITYSLAHYHAILHASAACDGGQLLRLLRGLLQVRPAEVSPEALAKVLLTLLDPPQHDGPDRAPRVPA